MIVYEIDQTVNETIVSHEIYYKLYSTCLNDFVAGTGNTTEAAFEDFKKEFFNWKNKVLELIQIVETDLNGEPISLEHVDIRGDVIKP